MAHSLAQSFTRNADQAGVHTFTQVNRIGDATIYRRDKLDGSLYGFEVLVVKCKAFPSPLGGLGPLREVYPSAQSFGKTAWFCSTLERAQARFDGLLAKRDNSSLQGSI